MAKKKGKKTSKRAAGGRERSPSARRATGPSKKATKKATATQTPPLRPGDIAWTELQSTDPARAVSFYSQLLGWKARNTPMGETEYVTFSSNGRDFGGVMKTQQPGLPSAWTTYFQVRSAEKACARASELGGQVIAPAFLIPGVGQLAVLQDPTGAYFALFAPPG